MRNQKFIKKTNRDVAQFGSAHGSGARGNRPIPFSKKHENGRKTAKTRDYASLKIRTSAFDHNFDQNWEIRNLISELIGVWHSLVVRMVRVHEVAGSNPVTPTIKTAGSPSGLKLRNCPQQTRERNSRAPKSRPLGGRWAPVA